MSENIAFAPRFASDEHEEIGDSIRLRLASGTSVASKDHKLRYSLGSSNQLTYGQILALGGDYYGLPSAPISDGGSLVSTYEAIIKVLTDQDLSDILGAVAWKEGGWALKTQLQESLAKSLPYLKTVDTAKSDDRTRFRPSEELFGLAYQTLETANFDNEISPLILATKGEASGATLEGKIRETIKFNNLTNGRYLALLLTNWDHFGTGARDAYSTGHAVALRQALKAHQTRSQVDLDLAYAINAFADHYLSDLFSGGHIRTPRKQLGAALAAGAMASNWMHDEDSSSGIMVRNKRGDIWVAYGDGKLAFAGNARNRLQLTEAVGTSALEIYRTFESGNLPKEYGALQLIPDLERAQNYTQDHKWNNVNGAAMFIWQSFEAKPAVQVRELYPNIYYYAWRRLQPSVIEVAKFYQQEAAYPYQHGDLAEDGTATIWRFQRTGADGTEVFFYGITPRAPFVDLSEWGRTPVFRAFPLQVQDSVKVYLYTKRISHERARPEDLVYYYSLDENIQKSQKDCTAEGVAFFAYREPRSGWSPVYFYANADEHAYYSLVKNDPYAAQYGFRMPIEAPQFYVKTL